MGNLDGYSQSLGFLPELCNGLHPVHLSARKKDWLRILLAIE